MARKAKTLVRQFKDKTIRAEHLLHFTRSEMYLWYEIDNYISFKVNKLTRDIYKILSISINLTQTTWIRIF